jgi:hypothetical protein
MHHHGAYKKEIPPLRRDDRHRAEINGRAALPFHRAPGNEAGHDLLVMNQRPDLAHDAPAPAWAAPDPAFGV